MTTTATAISTATAAGSLASRTAPLPAFYRYPSRRVVAMVADHVALEHLLDGLADAGVDLAQVQVMSGEDGRRRLDRTGRHHGLLARLHRGLVAALTSDSGDVLGLLDTALARGAVLIAVPARCGRGQGVDVAEVLIAHGAHGVLRFTAGGIDSTDAIR